VTPTREYHEATKYSPENLGSQASLNWAQQPEPYKTFHSTERVELVEDLLVGRDPVSGIPRLDDISAGMLDRAALSTLLLHTNGVTAVLKEAEGKEHLFRAAPSAGALYPTEIYVALRDLPDVADGLYNYQVRHHCLAPLLDGDFWNDLEDISFSHPAVRRSRCIMLFSAVFFRSSWRYHERAYRRILLDTGHVIGNATTFAPVLGHRCVPIPDFRDADLDALMLFDREAESSLLLAAVVEEDTGLQAGPRRRSNHAPTTCDVHSIPAVHQAGDLRGDETDGASPSDEAAVTVRGDVLTRPPISWTPDDLCQTILNRRSTRRLTGGPLPVEELDQVLATGYADRTEGRNRGDALIAPDLLKTWIIALNVTDLEPGVHAFDPETASRRLVRPGSFALQCHAFCLGQELGRDAAAVIVHTASLDSVDRRYGDRGYRYLGLDAGQIGERMNLAAVRLGLGVSGIGGYFDDQVCDVLELPQSEAVVYITVLGQPPQPF